MSAQSNKELVSQYFDRVWRQGDFDFAQSIIAPDYDLHLDRPSGFEVWKIGTQAVRASFEGIRFENHIMVADENMVAVRSIIRAVHSGVFMGIAPTGKPITAACADYYRIKDGKLVAHWDVVDVLTILLQIGALPQALAAHVDQPLKHAD